MSESKKEFKNETAVKSDTLLDFGGFRTGIALTPKNIIAYIAAIAAPFICQLLPLQAYGEKAGLAVGIFVMMLILLLSGAASLGLAAALYVLLSILTGTLDLNVFQGSVGSGLFFQFIGLSIVAYGIEVTPIGQRIIYLMLKRFGKKPRNIIFVMLTVTAILSSFLSNFATILIISLVAHKLLTSMGEKPGQSKFGTCLMISIVFAGVFGGMGFVQGSIGLTLLGINQVFTTTGYYISPAQWAMIGWPVLLLTIGLLTFITLKFYKFDEKAIAILDEKYYNEKLNELGPLGGSEYRWIIIVIALLTVMLIDFLPMNVVMLLFTAICLLPGIGFMTARDAFGKAVPWEIVFSSVSFPMVGVILANNGVISFLEAVVTPLVGNMHPFFLMLFICLMAGIINNALVSANFATNAIFVACMAPLVLAMGYNPAIILLPTIYMCSITVCLFPNAVMFINYNYGYWKPKDPILPGALAMVGFSVIACLFTYFLAPVLWGSSIIV